MRLKPRLLELFCGAGGASEGYRRAGFDVTAVDLFPQPNHRGGQFVQSDWRTFLASPAARRFDAYHASPVCKGYTNNATRVKDPTLHELAIPAVRQALLGFGKPFVIENVESAVWDMVGPVRLCGSRFGLRVRRHRLFESNVTLLGSGCAHWWQDEDQPYLVRGRYSKPTVSGVCPVFGGQQLLGVTKAKEHALRCDAMGIDWMDWDELTQAIPPAYSLCVGAQLMSYLR